MQQTNRTLFIIVVLILIINLVLQMRIGDLNNQIQNLSHNYNNLQSSISSISGNVNNTLAQFTREQSWISPVQVNNEKNSTENGQGLTVLNWQIKDFQVGAEVVFHYRESEFGEFQAIPAVSKGAGLFEVSMPLDIKVEPFWEINVSKIEKMGTKTSESAVMKPESVQSIGYYVSMKVKDTIKSSEVAYFDLAYLANVKYEPIQGHVAINNNKHNISLFEHYPSGNNFESVIVRFYDGNNVVVEKALEVEDSKNGARTYSLVYDAGSQNISRLVIQVKYANGDSFEKEVY